MKLFMLAFLIVTTGAVLLQSAIPVVELPSGEYPIVTVSIQFQTGSMDDPDGKHGLANLTAQLIIEGGTDQKTYLEIQDLLYPMAASMNVTVDKELITFQGDVHRDHLSDFYTLFKDLITRPRFDPGDFERIRQRSISTIQHRLRSSDDEQLGKETLSLFLFRGHPYEHAVTGTVHGLESITLEDVTRYHATRFTRNNVTVGLSGSYPDTFLSRVVKDLEALPDLNPERTQVMSPTVPDGRQVILVKKDTTGSAISIGFPIPVTRSHKDFPALILANSYLGEHRTFNGVLMNRMRGDRGLNYGDYSYVEFFREDPGTTFRRPYIARSHQYFSIWIRPVDPVNAPFAVRQALYETDRLIREGIPEEEFETTRNFLTNYTKLWVQSLSRRLGFLMDSRFYGQEDFIAGLEGSFSKLTSRQVSDVAKKYLQTDNLYIVIVTPEPEKLKTILEKEIPVPVLYQTPGTRCEILEEDKTIERYPLKIDGVTIVSSNDLFER